MGSGSQQICDNARRLSAVSYPFLLLKPIPIKYTLHLPFCIRIFDSASLSFVKCSYYCVSTLMCSELDADTRFKHFNALTVCVFNTSMVFVLIVLQLLSWHFEYPLLVYLSISTGAERKQRMSNGSLYCSATGECETLSLIICG